MPLVEANAFGVHLRIPIRESRLDSRRPNPGIWNDWYERVRNLWLTWQGAFDAQNQAHAAAVAAAIAAGIPVPAPPVPPPQPVMPPAANDRDASIIPWVLSNIQQGTFFVIPDYDGQFDAAVRGVCEVLGNERASSPVVNGAPLNGAQDGDIFFPASVVLSRYDYVVLIGNSIPGLPAAELGLQGSFWWARLLTNLAAWRRDMGQAVLGLMAAMAKYFGAEVVPQVYRDAPVNGGPADHGCVGRGQFVLAGGPVRMHWEPEADDAVMLLSALYAWPLIIVIIRVRNFQLMVLFLLLFLRCTLSISPPMYIPFLSYYAVLYLVIRIFCGPHFPHHHHMK